MTFLVGFRGIYEYRSESNVKNILLLEEIKELHSNII